jgi:sorbitol-specific phosphotransferase system component IIBC
LAAIGLLQEHQNERLSTSLVDCNGPLRCGCALLYWENGMNTIAEAIVYAIMWLAQIIMGDQT